MRCNSYLFIGYAMLIINQVTNDEKFPNIMCQNIANKSSQGIIKCKADTLTERVGAQQIHGVSIWELINAAELEIDLGLTRGWFFGINNFDFFVTNYKQLTVLTLKSKLYINDFKRPGQRLSVKQKFTDTFFKLSQLRNLTTENSNWDDEYEWSLPSTLEHVSFANNSYTGFNFSQQSELVYMNLEMNNFTRIPILSSPKPPIVELNLQNQTNNLFEITVEEIAQLCLLKRLFLPRLFNENWHRLNRSCECRRLQRWAGKPRDIEGTLKSLQCENEPSACANFTLHEAEKYYNACIARFHKRFATTSEPTSTQNNYMVFVILLVSIITAISVVYLLYGMYAFMTIEPVQEGFEYDIDYEDYITEEPN